MNRPLTKQQQAVYDFIRDKIVSRGYGPTVREIGEHMNIKSPNGVMCHLRALERKGMITRTANKSRAIELTEPISRLVGATLAVSGSIVGGTCLPVSSDDVAPVDIGAIAADDRSIMKVLDESLLDASILIGDWLVIQRQNLATSGQLAIVRTHDQTCLRYWFVENGRIRLQPVSRHATATFVEHAEVLGVIVGVIRSFDNQLN